MVSDRQVRDGRCQGPHPEDCAGHQRRRSREDAPDQGELRQDIEEGAGGQARRQLQAVEEPGMAEGARGGLRRGQGAAHRRARVQAAGGDQGDAAGRHSQGGSSVADDAARHRELNREGSRRQRRRRARDVQLTRRIGRGGGGRWHRD